MRFGAHVEFVLVRGRWRYGVLFVAQAANCRQQGLVWLLDCKELAYTLINDADN